MAENIMAQNFLVCDLCETSPVQMHCNKCATNLCKGCVGEHMIDTSKSHNVVLYKLRYKDPKFPVCGDHKRKCELHCRQCDIPICTKCIVSRSHKKHDVTELLEIFNLHKKELEKKTKELQTFVYPAYESNISNLEGIMAKLPENYGKLISDISEQGEEWHRAMDLVINRRKEEVEKMKTEDLTILEKILGVMKNLLSSLRQTIVDNNDLLLANDITEVMNRKTVEFSGHPPVKVVFPSLSFSPIQGWKLDQMFGALTKLSILGAEKYQTAEESATELHCHGTPSITSIIKTKYESSFGGALHNVACLSPDNIWVSGSGEEIKRFSLDGSLQAIVNTTTGNTPSGMTVTSQGDVVYTDYHDRSINRVQNGKIEKIISLQQGWKPLAICSMSSSDDLQVVMEKLSTPCQIVRYSGYIQCQIIKFNDQEKKLFSSGNDIFIAGNNDKDMICVSDTGSDTVVVINQAGKLRFRYTGNLSSKKYKLFSPRGVVIDSMGRTLVADYGNDCIHIIDQQGHFIRYIDNCQLNQPWDLSLDRNNTLYVAENDTAKVKVIKYLA